MLTLGKPNILYVCGRPCVHTYTLQCEFMKQHQAGPKRQCDLYMKIDDKRMNGYTLLLIYIYRYNTQEPNFGCAAISPGYTNRL